MPRLSPVSWQVLARVFEAEGYTRDRTRGSHLVMTKEGAPRALVIPRYDEVAVFIISGLLRTAGMRRTRYFELLRRCR